MKSKPLIISYLVFLLFTVVFSYSFLDSAIPFFTFLHPYTFASRELSSMMYVGFIFIFVLFYVLFLRKLNRVSQNEQYLITIVLCTSVLIISYPAMLSYDIYNYVATARVAFLYGENPYVVMPIELVGEPMISFMHAANKTALYGPSWILLTAIPYFAGVNSFIFTLFLTKLLVVSFYFATVYILHKMVKSIYSLAFFALHPLVVIETFVSSHNDIAMMFFALTGMYFLQKKRVIFAVIFLIISILVKFATVALVPVFLYVFLKQYKHEAIDWGKIYIYAFISMITVFFLSFVREEIYPWYAVWFLVFLPLISITKLVRVSIIIFSCTLLFRYVPFMYTGSHFGVTPYLKWIITFLPVTLFILLTGVSKRWLKK